MPTYDYKCSACGKTYELFLPVNSSVEQVCPACGMKTFRMLSPTPGFVRNSSFKTPGRNAGNCDRNNPCCGLEQPCDHRPCE